MVQERNESEGPEFPSGLYVLPATGDEVEVTRPEGWGYPLVAQVRWMTSDPGRDAMTQMLADVLFLEWDRVTLAVAAGETYTLVALSELAQRAGWLIESRLPEAPDRFRLTREGGESCEGMRLDLLRAAGAEHATVLVIAVDDVDASVRIAETARRHFPSLRVLARARNRQHAFRLMDAGVGEVWRETLASSLEVAESTLVALGSSPGTAADQVRRFREHDEATLRAQAAVKDDEGKLIATAQASAQQLESLFEADQRPV